MVSESFNLKAHLKHLSEIAAPPGHEGPMRDTLREAWTGLVDEFRTDNLGSLIATRYGTGDEPRPRIMLCAHMDEIGLLVADIRDGFIRPVKLGNVDFRVLLHQPVQVHGRRVLNGLVGAAPPHMSLNRKKYPSASELWIDVGLPADEVAQLVRVGDLITIDAPPIDLRGERIAGKSMDNRASVAAVTWCLDALGRQRHAWDVIAVATVQEESYGTGAVTATYAVQPDLAIVIDGTFARQMGTNDDESFPLGSGPTLSQGPNFHPRLVKAIRQTATTQEIKLQVEIVPGDSGTDAWAVQVSREGVPTALLGIPMRSMHTPVEVVDLRDVARTGRLMAAFIAGLEPDFLDTITWEEGQE